MPLLESNSLTGHLCWAFMNQRHFLHMGVEVDVVEILRQGKSLDAMERRS